MAKPLTYAINLTPETTDELTTLPSMKKLILARVLIALVEDELKKTPKSTIGGANV